MVTGFVAYPSNPSEIGEAIRGALALLAQENPEIQIMGWEEADIAGKFIIEPILGQIGASDILAADITRLNFNVMYEIGFAIGKKRRLLLIRNGSLQADDDLIRTVGIIDTIGYKSYLHSRELATRLAGVSDLSPIEIADSDPSKMTALFLVLPKSKTDTEIQLVSRVKKSRLRFQSFDPEEEGRLSGVDAIRQVANAHGVIVPLIPSARQDAKSHNFRAAFVAGLAHGMEKETLLLQYGPDPVPMDYRDFICHVPNQSKLDEYFGEFNPLVTARLQMGLAIPSPSSGTLLAKLNLGASSAENEMASLEDYYVETEEYRRVSRGESQIVTGRKGSGKTALFVRARDNVRKFSQNVVLDLRPEGFQLLKFKDIVLAHLEQGTKEHTITAFWEYLLLLEICHKVLENDKTAHLANHRLFEPYKALADEYYSDVYISEGDFAERVLKLTERIIFEFEDVIGPGDKKTRLSNEELTNLLYKHDVKRLRDKLSAYLSEKKCVWILFDNIDKGWPAIGLGADDVLILRSLIDAIAKLEKHFRKLRIECHGVVFIRNDVYEILIQHTPDRGKTSRVILDWTDPEMLREMIRLRCTSIEEIPDETAFEVIWPQICVSHLGSQESSTYLIDRCLMRPRSLIDFIHYCRSHAINLRHTKIEGEDIQQGEDSYSSELVANISLEIQDVFPGAADVLYGFIGYPKKVRHDHVLKAFDEAAIPKDLHDQVFDLLLWYGFLGIIRDTGDIAYIYNVRYDMKRLKAILRAAGKSTPVYYINPAFWTGLEIHD